MAKIGNWGSRIRFEVNNRRQLPFEDMRRSVKANWATHNVRGWKPKAEYIGAEQTSIKLKITFSAYRGQKPARAIADLQMACAHGETHYLYIGGHRIGDGKHYIESIDTDWDEVWNRGELVRATSNITFKEYEGGPT